MTPEVFRTYLRTLQTDKYSWPNDYFVWEKPDKSYFMLGIRSGYYFNLLKHEFEQQIQATKTYLYGIDPHAVYYHHSSPDKPAVIHDPVDSLVEEVGQYRFLGFWRDPDHMMDSLNGRVLAHGRFDMALKQIQAKEQTVSPDDMLQQLFDFAQISKQNFDKRAGELYER